MKIIIIQIGDIYEFPPVLSLIHALEELKEDTVVISTIPSGDYSADFHNTVFDIIPHNYEAITSPAKKLGLLPKMHNELWNKIDQYYDNDSLLWVVTDVTLKYLGKQLLTRNYILHLLELSQELLLYKHIDVLKYDAEKYSNSAKAVVVPEYNRAHITKAWWKLGKMPFILPNKPYLSESVHKNEVIEDKVAAEVINRIGDKKIILYQGILNNERPLEPFIHAVDELGDGFAFVIMSKGDNIYSNIESSNYFYIPYIRPPKHLQVTSHAYIGVLSYVPTYNSGYSPLNSLYCAPNKTFEFSKFGIPMIGNDIPGLRYLLGTEKIGECYSSFESKEIVKAIEKIQSNYNYYSSNSSKYYLSCDYRQLLKDILDKIE